MALFYMLLACAITIIVIHIMLAVKRKEKRDLPLKPVSFDVQSMSNGAQYFALRHIDNPILALSTCVPSLGDFVILFLTLEDAQVFRRKHKLLESYDICMIIAEEHLAHPGLVFIKNNPSFIVKSS